MGAMPAVLGCCGVLSVFDGGTASPRHSCRLTLPFGKSSVSVFGAGAESINQLGKWRWSVCLRHCRRREFSVFSNRSVIDNENEAEKEEEEEVGGGNDNLQFVATLDDVFPEENMAIFAACLVGLLTGIGVVLFNIAVCCYVLILAFDHNLSIICFPVLKHSMFALDAYNWILYPLFVRVKLTLQLRRTISML